METQPPIEARQKRSWLWRLTLAAIFLGAHLFYFAPYGFIFFPPLKYIFALGYSLTIADSILFALLFARLWRSTAKA